MSTPDQPTQQQAAPTPPPTPPRQPMTIDVARDDRVRRLARDRAKASRVLEQ